MKFAICRLEFEIVGCPISLSLEYNVNSFSCVVRHDSEELVLVDFTVSIEVEFVDHCL